jgi:hypothetical protein
VLSGEAINTNILVFFFTAVLEYNITYNQVYLDVSKETRENITFQLFIVVFLVIFIPKQPSIAPLSVFNFTLICTLNWLIDVFRQCIVSHQKIFIIKILPDNYRVRIMVFNATFNNISFISWQSVLLVEYRLQVTDKLYHIMLYRVHLAWTGFKLATLVVEKHLLYR